MADQVLKARDAGVTFDIGIERPGGGYAVASLDQDVLAKLNEVLTELQGKLEAGQEVALNAATLSALETVNANITEPLTVDGTVDLGVTTLAALEEINANVSGTVNVGNAVALDTATLTSLESVTATISGTVTVDTGLQQPLTESQLRSQAVDVNITQQQPLTDVQLRANPVPVDTGMTVQTDALTNTELRASPVVVDTQQPDPQTDALTDTELRATPVIVDTQLNQPVEDGGTVNVGNHPADFPDAASQGFLDNRYGGGKQSSAMVASTSGDSIVVSPAVGNRVQVYWVSAITIPTSTSPPVIQFRFGENDPFYSAFAVSHWEVFTGGIDEDLIINLSNSDTVAVTVHYKEV